MGTIFTFSLHDRRRVGQAQVNLKMLWLMLPPLDRSDTLDELEAIEELLNDFGTYLTVNIGQKNPQATPKFDGGMGDLIRAEDALDKLQVILAHVPVLRRRRVFKERRDGLINVLTGIVGLIKRTIAGA